MSLRSGDRTELPRDRLTAVLDAGLELTGLEEHDTVPWPALAPLMDELPNGEHRLRDRPERLPATYTLQARRR